MPLKGDHHTSLNHRHEVTTARTINTNELMFHLLNEHGISLKNLKTRGQLGRAHLLAHAAMAWPGLAQLMNLPEDWGSGSWPPAKR